MGLLNASMLGALPTMLDQGGSQPQQPNQFLSAFQNNPQFMQQLQAIQNGQGPGSQAPRFTPPPMQMSTSVQGMGGNGQIPARGYGLSDRAGYDALAFLRGTAF